MTARPTFTTREWMLQRGDRCSLPAVKGMVLVCVEGSVHRTELVPQAEGVLPYAVQVPMRAGESHLFEQAVSIALAADCQVRLLCLRPQPIWRVWGARLLRYAAKYAMITNIRRGVEQSGSSSGS